MGVAVSPGMAVMPAEVTVETAISFRTVSVLSSMDTT